MAGDHPKRIGKYEIIEPIGEGGMGIVYKARDPIIGRIVAIKTILGDSSEFTDDNLVARLTQEAKAAGRLQHPNIVTVYDFGQQDDLTYLAMEYIEGTNLARVISKGRQITLATKVDIIIQICQGLAYAHEAGVVHRDIKPANICLTGSGTPKILDFGLARFDETRLTKTGFTSGTVAYMSPERMRGNSGPHDDIFALGAVAYEILTHQVAFPGKTYKEVVSKIMSPKYPVPPSEVAKIPKGLDPIILKALSRDLGERYKSATDMARDLDRVRNTREFQDMVAAESVLRTVEQPVDVFDQTGSGSHPYTAGEIARRRSDEVEEESPPTDQYAVNDFGGRTADQPTSLTEQRGMQDAPTMITRQQPEEAPPTKSWDDVHFAKTEMELPPVRRDAPASPPERTEVSLGARAGKQQTPAVPAAPVPLHGMPDSLVARTEPGGRLAPDAAAPAGPPVVTPVAEAVEAEVKPKGAPAPAVITKILAASFVPALAALFVATFAATWAGRFLVPSSYLIVYAIAVAIWVLVLKSAPSLPLDRIIFVAIGLRLLCFFAAPSLGSDIHRFEWDGLVASAEMSPWALAPSAEELTPLRNDAFARLAQPDVPSNGAPLTVLLSMMWGWVGNSLPVWRLVLLGFDVLVVWLLWSPQAPRRALAWAAMPLVALSGVWGGSVAPIGVAMLVAAFALASRRGELGSGALSGLSAGTSLVPFAAIPALMYVVEARLRVALVFLAVALAPYFFVGFGPALVDPLSRVVASSPSLGVIQRELALRFDQRGQSEKATEAAISLGNRLGIDQTNEWVATHLGSAALAAIAIAAVLLVILLLVARGSRTRETAAANCVGVALVLSCASPVSWLFVVPFAILSNRSFWLLFAIFSPVVYLAGSPGGEVNWLVQSLAYALPLLAFAGVKLAWKEPAPSPLDMG